MKRIKRIMGLMAVAMLLLLAAPICQAKTIKGITAHGIYSKGNTIYYTEPYGAIYKYTPKTRKAKKIRGAEGTTFGYSKLIVKGKYIYASLCRAGGTGDEDFPYDIYRISKNGKNRKRIAKKTTGDFVIAGKKIFYQREKDGAWFSSKLNGTKKN